MASHHFADAKVIDAILLEVYDGLSNEDKERAYEAYQEELELPSFEERLPSALEEVGVVNRRAPINPLQRRQTLHAIKDPALRHNPLRGRLILLFSTSLALLLVFLQSLVFNKTTIGTYIAPPSENGMFGPSSEVFYWLGGLHTNAIRANKEYFRIFWAAWMHSGWLHIGFNVLSQMQFFFMFEPDWGFWRTLLLFWVSGVTGNLLSAVADPCTTTVGSSGGLFGLMGAMLPYCVEYWKTIPRPGCILVFTFVVVVISLLVGFTGNTDNWAHGGGLIGGILWAMATTTTLSAFEKMIRRCKGQPEEEPVKPGGKGRPIKRVGVARRYQQKIQPDCRCGKSEWCVRLTGLVGLAVTWTVLFVLLLQDYEFEPAGHIKFSDTSQCTCCFSNVDGLTEPRKHGVPWYCFHKTSEIRDWRRLKWGDFCQMPLNQIVSLKLPQIDPIGRATNSTRSHSEYVAQRGAMSGSRLNPKASASNERIPARIRRREI